LMDNLSRGACAYYGQIKHQTSYSKHSAGSLASTYG
jgi:hypothetical protein